MTELEHILKETLTMLELELTTTQESHKKTLASHAQAIQHLQESVRRIEVQQTESAQHLQRLSAIHSNLEPLLSRLNALLNGR